jgi:hypothetical protein
MSINQAAARTEAVAPEAANPETRPEIASPGSGPKSAVAEPGPAISTEAFARSSARSPRVAG